MIPLTLLVIVIAIAEGLLVWYLRSELKKMQLDEGWRKVTNAPQQMTAKDMAAGNLQRQVERMPANRQCPHCKYVHAVGQSCLGPSPNRPVTRKPHDWKALRQQIENGIEVAADKENEREKRVENFNAN